MCTRGVAGFLIYFLYGIRHSGEHMEIVLDDEEEEAVGEERVVADPHKSPPHINGTPAVAQRSPQPNERSPLLA